MGGTNRPSETTPSQTGKGVTQKTQFKRPVQIKKKWTEDVSCKKTPKPGLKGSADGSREKFPRKNSKGTTIKKEVGDAFRPTRRKNAPIKRGTVVWGALQARSPIEEPGKPSWFYFPSRRNETATFHKKTNNPAKVINDPNDAHQFKPAKASG